MKKEKKAEREWKWAADQAALARVVSVRHGNVFVNTAKERSGRVGERVSGTRARWCVLLRGRWRFCICCGGTFNRRERCLHHPPLVVRRLSFIPLHPSPPPTLPPSCNPSIPRPSCALCPSHLLPPHPPRLFLHSHSSHSGRPCLPDAGTLDSHPRGCHDDGGHGRAVGAGCHADLQLRRPDGFHFCLVFPLVYSTSHLLSHLLLFSLSPPSRLLLFPPPGGA